MTCKHEGGTDPCECYKDGTCKIYSHKKYLSSKSRYSNSKYRARNILTAHRLRGKALQVPSEWVLKFIDKGCPVFDIPYRLMATGHGMDSPTIDHFDPNGGNGEGNLWVISKLANQMKSNGTLDHAIKLLGWWATVQHFQRTLTDEEFFKLRDTMNGRIKETIKTTIEEARRCLSSSSSAKGAKGKSNSSSSTTKSRKAVPVAVRSKKSNGVRPRKLALENSGKLED